MFAVSHICQPQDGWDTSIDLLMVKSVKKIGNKTSMQSYFGKKTIKKKKSKKINKPQLLLGKKENKTISFLSTLPFAGQEQPHNGWAALSLTGQSSCLHDRTETNVLKSMSVTSVTLCCVSKLVRSTKEHPSPVPSYKSLWGIQPISWPQLDKTGGGGGGGETGCTAHMHPHTRTHIQPSHFSMWLSPPSPLVLHHVFKQLHGSHHSFILLRNKTNGVWNYFEYLCLWNEIIWWIVVFLMLDFWHKKI